MAALNFPDPNVTTTYTSAGKTWRWNGTSWVSGVSNVDFTTSASYAVTSSYAANAGSGGGGGTTAIVYVIDGGGCTITTGSKGDLVIPFACTITEWTLLADQQGSINVNILKAAYGSYPPTTANSITGSAAVSITNGTNNQSTALTGWTTAVAANDTLRFVVGSASTIRRATLTLKATK